jgi:hypothetical protein
MPHVFGSDAYAPQEIAVRVTNVAGSVLVALVCRAIHLRLRRD